MGENVTTNNGDDELIHHTNNDDDNNTVTDVVNHVQKEDHLFEYCDESKCVSSLLLRVGRIGEDDGNDNNTVPTFTCYAEGNEMSPFACAEGYQGFVIENESLFLYEGNYLSYYTCCLPLPSPTSTPLPVSLSLLSNSTSITEHFNESSSSSSSSVGSIYQRHCSNTIVIGSNNVEKQEGEKEERDRRETNLCRANIFDDSILEKKYLRHMTKNFGHLKSYTCCDELLLPVPPLPVSSSSSSSSSNKNSNSTSTVSKLFPFLDDVECVPYLCIDVFDYDCISKNRYGALMTMSCRDDLYNGLFLFPKIVATNNDQDEIRFECCKTGTNTHLLPTNAPAFQKTYCVHLVLSSFALVSLLILIVGILKGKKKDVAPSAATKSLRGSSISITRRSSTTTLRSRSFTSGSLSLSIPRPSISRSSSMASMSRSIRQQQQQQHYSPYNLYLVFLALPDVILSTFMIWRCSSALTGHTFKNHTWTILDWNGTTDIARYSGAIFWTCSTANVCMNCVIALEVFQFLKKSFQLVRNPQPSLWKVSLQAAFVYIYSIVVNLIVFSFFAKYRGTPEVYYVMTIGYPLLLLCTFLGPFLFLIVICILIWKRGYILKTDQRYKNLALYFLRIVIAFLLLWVPTSVLVILHLLPVQIGYADGASPVFAMYANESVLPVYAISMILISLQALLTVVMALLKPDVQTMVMELFTSCCCCCYCYHDNSNNNIKGSKGNSNKTISEPPQELEGSMPIQKEENKVNDKARTTTQQLLMCTWHLVLPVMRLVARMTTTYQCRYLQYLYTSHHITSH